MLESLITSKTRIKLMLKFFLNPDSQAYLRGLAGELNESTNAVRVELNRFTEADLLERKKEGRTVVYKANKKHPLFPEIHNIVMKYTGINQLVDDILANIGDVEYAFITGDYARGVDSGTIDLVLVGDINEKYLKFLVKKTEEVIQRKIRTETYSNNELEGKRKSASFGEALLVWNKGQDKI